jgi:hypothetical protein
MHYCRHCKKDETETTFGTTRNGNKCRTCDACKSVHGQKSASKYNQMYASGTGYGYFGKGWRGPVLATYQEGDMTVLVLPKSAGWIA